MNWRVRNAVHRVKLRIARRLMLSTVSEHHSYGYNRIVEEVCRDLSIPLRFITPEKRKPLMLEDLRKLAIFLAVLSLLIGITIGISTGMVFHRAF